MNLPQAQAAAPVPQFVIPEPLANKILNYLGNRPYIEVYEMIGAMLRLEKAPEAVMPPTPEAMAAMAAARG